MTGTPSQIELAEQIKSSVNAEFDRVANAFHAIAQKQWGRKRVDTLALIRILEEKRAEVMMMEQGGYFICTWRELKDQVRQMIRQDDRYRAIRANRMTDRDTCGGVLSEEPGEGRG